MNVFDNIRKVYEQIDSKELIIEEVDLSDQLNDLDQWAMNNSKIAVSDVLENGLAEHECEMWSDLVNQDEEAAAALYRSALALAKNFGYKGERVIKESLEYSDAELAQKLVKMYKWSMSDNGNKKVTQMLEKAIKGLVDHFKDELRSIVKKYVEEHRERSEDLYRKSVNIMDDED